MGLFLVIEGLRTPGDKSATLPTFSFSAHAMGDRVETLGEDAAALMLVPLKNTSGELHSSSVGAFLLSILSSSSSSV